MTSKQPSNKPMSEAQMRQQQNRDGGGQYAAKTHGAPDLSKAGLGAPMTLAEVRSGGFAADSEFTDDSGHVYSYAELRDGTGFARGATFRPGRPHWGEVFDVPVVDGQAPREWGSVNFVEHPAEGIVRVDASGHGGFVLSEARNAAIPEALRTDDGIYEEDCEAYIVGMYHPEAYEVPSQRYGRAYVREVSTEGVRNWFPDGYQAVTGKPIALGESHEADRTGWHAEHAEDYVATSARMAEGYEQPQVEVTMRCEATSHTVTVLVPEVEYDAPRESHGLFNPPYHLPWNRVPTAAKM